MKYEIAADLIRIAVNVIANATHNKSTFIEVSNLLQRLGSLVKIPEATKEQDKPCKPEVPKAPKADE